MHPKRYALLLMAALTVLASPAAAHTALDFPNGGEAFTTGEVVTIRWHIYISHALENWDLWYAVDNGTTFTSCSNQAGFDWIVIEMDIPATCTNAGGNCSTVGGCQMEYAWTIPDGIDSENVKIRVRMDNVSIDYYDVSNEPFSIRSGASVIDRLGDRGFLLRQNSPNPFRPTTTIPFVLANQTDRALLRIFDPEGRVIRKLVDGPRGIGYHTVIWNGADDRGERLPSGTYFYTLEIAGKRETRKVILID